MRIKRWLRAALTDWVNLLQGPSPPIFKSGDVRIDFSRLFRLLAIVLILVNAVSGPIALIYQNKANPGKFWSLTSFLPLLAQNGVTLLFLPIGAAVAFPYSFFIFPLMRVEMTFPKTFFTFLFLGLPWLPLWILIHRLAYVQAQIPAKSFIIWLMMCLMAIANISNLRKGVSLVSTSANWRVWIALLLPLALVASISIYRVTVGVDSPTTDVTPID